MSDANEAFPKLKRGKAKYPQVGEMVYVPTIEDHTQHVIGGRATVTELRGHSLSSKVVLIAEHPNVKHVWVDIRDRQYDLWERFAMLPARMPNDEEKDALAAKLAAEKAAVEARRVAAAAEERAKWEPKKFAVLGGALIERPISESHYRSRNWVALVTFNPVLPGGMNREWFERGGGKIETFILAPRLAVHDVVEFGADYIQGTGKRIPARWYGVVLEVTTTHLLLQPCKDAIGAFKLSAAKRLPPPQVPSERAVG
jgi:hypothetical protein